MVLVVLMLLLTKSLSLEAQGLGIPDDDSFRLIEPSWTTGSAVRPSELRREKINWSGLMQQSFLFLGIQQGFRLYTEEETRKRASGPFFQDYVASVSNLHGWSDGDEFYVNYVGHPMEGAVAGNIFAQNDVARYRFVQFGRNRDYWMSRVRGVAFSYLYSLQFEIGPVSEASIGNIQSHPPEVGFVDHVVTPIAGLGWMIGEDALDRYVIARIEKRVHNRYAKVLVRGWLNPARSFANMMAFKVPWHRDTRPGIFGDDPDGEAVQWLLENRGTVDPGVPLGRDPDAVLAPVEVNVLFEPYNYSGTGGTACYGGSGSAGFRIGQRWQALLDVGGCKLQDLDANRSGDSLHYLTGLRWVPGAAGRWSFGIHVLAGGEKLTHELVFPDKNAALMAEWKAQGSNTKTKPDVVDYTATSDITGFSMRGGVGLDYRINAALQLRVVGLEYGHSWLPRLDGRDYSNSFGISTGLILCLGTW